MRRPELELCVAGRGQLYSQRVAAIVDLDAANDLRVTPIEPFGEPDEGAEQPHGPALGRGQIRVPVVRLLRLRLAMISRGERDDLDLVGVETAQVPVFDQVIRVFVVALVADVVADVVQERAVLEPLALARAQSVLARRRIEERERQLRDLLRVRGPIATSLGQLHDAAAPYVWIPIDRTNVRRVLLHVIEHEPFAQREIAERQIVGAELRQERIEEHDAR